MSLGKMNTFVEILEVTSQKDDEGFTRKDEKYLYKVRSYLEERHGSLKWANMAAYTKANAIFQLRKIPGFEIMPGMILRCDRGDFKVISVELIKSRYIELATEKIEPV
ncbi:MAG: head-tail adaptor protein [Clostridia bacterium]|nr:head-tail adaptor protein [Clostridia bacterium]